MIYVLMLLAELKRNIYKLTNLSSVNKLSRLTRSIFPLDVILGKLWGPKSVFFVCPTPSITHTCG